MSDRLALIIANSTFNDPKLRRLKTPCRDAEALAEVLEDPAIGGFDVIPLVDQTLREVRAHIGRLYRRRTKDDILLLYYSGHGIRDDYDDLYLAVKDTETDNASATAIDASFVRSQLDRSGSQRKVVILDCCHSGAFVRGAKAALGSSAGTLKAFEGNGYGRVILTASNAIEYAWEGDKPLGKATTSVFTRFLVEGLQTGAADRNGDGEISLDELYDYVYERVITSGLSKQTPQKWAQKVEGRIIIARGPHPVPPLPEPPPETRRRHPETPQWPGWVKQIPPWGGAALGLLAAGGILWAILGSPPGLTPVDTPTPTPTQIVAPTIAPSPATSTPSPSSTATASPSPSPSPTATDTPTPTPVPVTAPTLTFPEQGQTYEGAITFEWQGRLGPGQTYMVYAWHHDSGYSIQGGPLSDTSWTAGLPGDKFGEWRWNVSVLQAGTAVATSDEGMFWYDPFPNSGDGAPPSPPGPY